MDFWVVLPLVNYFSKFRGHEQSLQETVHVAGGSEIGESFITAILFLHEFEIEMNVLQKEVLLNLLIWSNWMGIGYQVE